MEHKFKGSTLLEVIIAMVITLASFAIISNVWMSSGKGFRSRVKVKAELLLNDHLNNLKENNEFVDRSYEYPEFTIRQVVSQYKEHKDLLLVRLVAIDHDGNELFGLNGVIREDIKQ